MGLTLTEQEHNQRAKLLRQAFNTEGLAEFLHKTYRAAFKAMNREGKITKVGAQRFYHGHDHGFIACHRQKYFTKRAEMLLTDVKDHL